MHSSLGFRWRYQDYSIDWRANFIAIDWDIALTFQSTWNPGAITELAAYYVPKVLARPLALPVEALVSRCHRPLLSESFVTQSAISKCPR